MCEESRSPVSTASDPRLIDKTLAGGKKKRFIMKPSTSRWSISWDYMPWSSDQSFDGGAGFYELSSMATDGRPLVFTTSSREGPVVNSQSYQVFVTDFSSEVSHRRGDLTNWRWKVNLELEQIE
jgi:hypothetical protein